jgi:hypothetical protein
MRLDFCYPGLTDEMRDQLYEGEVEWSDLVEMHDIPTTDGDGFAASIALCQLPDGKVAMGMDRDWCFAGDDDTYASVELTASGAKRIIAVLVGMFGDEILPD